MRAGLTNKQTAPKFCAHGVLLGLRPSLAKVNERSNVASETLGRGTTKSIIGVCVPGDHHTTKLVIHLRNREELVVGGGLG